MKVGLLSYNYMHLKTEQVFEKLLEKKFELQFYLLPFKQREKREVFFEHRPNQENSVAIEVLAKSHNIPIKYLQDFRGGDLDNECDVYLILGASILNEEAIRGKKIINCHPGVIPLSRGLDSFKWSIYHDEPLGITLHYIDKEADKGEIISIVKTNVYRTDSLETLARRHYENEIDVLANFEKYIDNPKFDFKNLIEKEAKMRMPIDKEMQMARKFEEYKESIIK